ncbi:hypothetical protein AABB24_031149, partial [Solanum stoloniferum]
QILEAQGNGLTGQALEPPLILPIILAFFFLSPILAGNGIPSSSPPDTKMSVTIAVPENPVQQDNDAEALLDSINRNGDLLTTTSIEDSSSSDKTGSHKEKNSISSARCFRVELTPDNIAVAMVYFVQGVLGLSDLAVSFYLKDDLHLDPAEWHLFFGFEYND